jgi:hypothetical protein
MFFQENFMNAFMNQGVGGHFHRQLRCFSAPFFQGGDTKKIQELNFGGKVSFNLDVSIFLDLASKFGA